MNILEVTLVNPIGYTEIECLVSEIKACGMRDYLIIDTGKHDFVSVDVIKYFKAQMQALKTQLLNFKKIALIHPPDYKNKSSEPEIYDYFTSRIEAIDWFLI